MKILKPKSTKLLLTGIALLFAYSISAEAVNVCPTCTSKTIAAGIEATPPNGTVTIYAGTYYEQGLVINKPLTLNSLNGAGAVIDAGRTIDPATPAPAALINGTATAITVTSTASPVIIKNLTINNSAGNGIQVNDGIYQVTIQNMNINNAAGNCIYAGTGSNQLTVTGSSLNNCGYRGVQAYGYAATIKNSTIKNTIYPGIEIGGDFAVVAANKVFNIHNNTAIYIVGASAEVTENNVYAARGDGIAINGNSPVIKNNKISGTSYRGINVTCGVCGAGKVSANNIYNVGQEYLPGMEILANGPDLLVQNNVIDTVFNQGIYLHGGGATMISNNTISNVGTNYDCIYATDAAHKIKNNIIDKCGANGIWANSTGIEVFNNNIKNAGRSGVYAAGKDVNVHDNKIQYSTGFGVINGNDLSYTGVQINHNVIQFNRNQICITNPGNVATAGNTGNGATWVAGTDFGALNDSCNFLGI